MIEFTISKQVAAPPEAVFDALTDHRAYPSFTPIRKATLEREGTDEPNGVGAIRVLSLVGPPLREEVVEYVPGKRFVYRLLSGIPVHDHVGTVTLATSGTGTLMSYHLTTTPNIALSAPVLGAVMKRSIDTLASGVAKEAVRRAGSA